MSWHNFPAINSPPFLSRLEFGSATTETEGLSSRTWCTTQTWCRPRATPTTPSTAWRPASSRRPRTRCDAPSSAWRGRPRDAASSPGPARGSSRSGTGSRSTSRPSCKSVFWGFGLGMKDNQLEAFWELGRKSCRIRLCGARYSRPKVTELSFLELSLFCSKWYLVLSEML